MEDEKKTTQTQAKSHPDEPAIVALARIWGKESDLEVIKELLVLCKNLPKADVVYQILVLFGFYSAVMKEFPYRLAEMLTAATSAMKNHTDHCDLVLAKALERAQAQIEAAFERCSSDLDDFIKSLPITTREELINFFDSAEGRRALEGPLAPVVQSLANQINMLNSADQKRQQDTEQNLARMEAISKGWEESSKAWESTCSQTFWVLGTATILLLVFGGIVEIQRFRESRRSPAEKIQRGFDEAGLRSHVQINDTGVTFEFTSRGDDVKTRIKANFEPNGNLIVDFPTPIDPLSFLQNSTK